MPRHDKPATTIKRRCLGLLTMSMTLELTDFGQLERVVLSRVAPTAALLDRTAQALAATRDVVAH